MFSSSIVVLLWMETLSLASRCLYHFQFQVLIVVRQLRTSVQTAEHLSAGGRHSSGLKAEGVSSKVFVLRASILTPDDPDSVHPFSPSSSPQATSLMLYGFVKRWSGRPTPLIVGFAMNPHHFVICISEASSSSLKRGEKDN